MSLARYRMFAGYNAWANGQVYDACGALPPEAWSADRGAFFGSLMGTLNHILVADRIWMSRLTGEGGTYDRLDALPYPDLGAAREAREAEDTRIAAYVEGLTQADLDGPFRYRSIAGLPFEQPRWTVLDHVFNHQTHHRGQAHGLITAAGGPSPVLDLVAYQRLAGLVPAAQTPDKRV